MGILDNYMRQVEEDKNKENDDFDMTFLDEDTDNVGKKPSQYNQSEKEEFVKQLQKLRSDPNDIMNKFYNEFEQINENTLQISDHISDVSVSVYVRRAYCHNCGKELISKAPVMFNPYTGEKIAKYECSCGAKYNLEYAYPRVIFKDDNGNEINAFGN